MLQKNKNVSLVNTVLALHGLVLALLLACFGKFLFIPLFFSFLISIFLYPLGKRFEKYGLNRLASSLLCIVILVLCCGVVLYFVGSQTQRFVKDIPQLKTS
jgi:predicted PurR-regulated permease PerM